MLRCVQRGLLTCSALQIDQKDKDAPPDPLASVEKAVVDKQNATTAAKQIAALQALQEDRWSDPYELSKKLRTNFRADKKERKVRDASDDAVRGKFGLPNTLLLEDESVEEQDRARALWKEEQAKNAGSDASDRRKRRRMEAELGLPSASTPVASSSRSSSNAKVKLADDRKVKRPKTAAESLSSRLLLPAKHARDPFLKGISASSSSSLGIKLGRSR